MLEEILVAPLWADFALLLQRAIVGAMMVLYRFRWFYDPSQQQPWFSEFREQKLKERLCSCRYPVNFWMCFSVSSVEVLGGLALIVGLLTVPAAFGILVILLFATYCTAWENTEVQKPIDCVDVVSCYLRTIEPLYITLCICIVFQGPGQYSLDSWVWQWLILIR